MSGIGKHVAAAALAFAVLSGADANAQASMICDIRGFGAQPDDEKADTKAIQTAIDACAKVGGQVVIPRGRWLSGGLELRSDMRFTLAPGSVLAAIPDIALYPERTDASVNSDFTEASDAYQAYRAFLYAGNVKNLVIEGPGTLDGQGEKFWDPDFYNLKIPRPTRPRPQQMIELVDCGAVTVRDLHVINAPAYSVRFYRCNGIRAENVTVRNDPRSPNTDGIQIRDTSNAFISGADIATGDDAIVVKSYDRMIENLIVTDSILVSDDSAIKFGTAGHKGVRNSRFSNITIRDSRYGIALFQMDGGAYLDNVFRDITIETGGRATNFFAIYADIDRRKADSPLGRIENLTLSGLDVTTAGNVLISGQPEAPIRGLTLTDVTIRTPETAQSIVPTRRKPRGNAFVPPTGKTEDHAGVASTVTIANTADLTITGLAVTHRDPKIERSALALVNVRSADISGLALNNAAASAAPALRLSHSADVLVSDVRRLTNVTTALAVTDRHEGRLTLRNADLSGMPLPLSSPKGVEIETLAVAGLAPLKKARR
jgi:polygalacturonase